MIRKYAAHHPLRPLRVMHVGGGDVGSGRISVAVDGDMSLDALDTPASVNAGYRIRKPRAHAPAVYDRHGREKRLAGFMELHDYRNPEGPLKVSPGAPAAVMVMDGLVWRIAHRETAPPAAGIDNEEDSLRDTGRVMLA